MIVIPYSTLKRHQTFLLLTLSLHIAYPLEVGEMMELIHGTNLVITLTYVPDDAVLDARY